MALVNITKVPTVTADMTGTSQKISDVQRNTLTPYTDKAQAKRMNVFMVETDGVDEAVEIQTDFLRATSGFAFQFGDGYKAITVKPKDTNPSIAVVTGLTVSTQYYWVILYGA